MNEDESKIKEIFSRIIKVPTEQLGNDDDLAEKYGMDSLQRVEVITELEKAFDIMIDDSVSVELRTVGKYLDFVRSQMTQK